MEIIITIAFLVYIGYREWLISKHIQELELKAFSKTPQEYATYKSIEKPEVAEAEEESDLIDPFDAEPSDVLKGRKI